MTHRLLSRTEFERQVFARDGHTCVFCPAPAVDAHHILERKLFTDGGYYLDNGASVCAEHHWACETTQLSPEEVRAAAGITQVVVPEGLSLEQAYDKWGNKVRKDGFREPGPLYFDAGCRKALSRGGRLGHVVPEGTPLLTAEGTPDTKE